MTEPTHISSRYHEVHVDHDSRGSIIEDRATGETVLIFGSRRWQRLVLTSLNLAEGLVDTIETREAPAA